MSTSGRSTYEDSTVVGEDRGAVCENGFLLGNMGAIGTIRGLRDILE
jgi:hypothetical protein